MKIIPYSSLFMSLKHGSLVKSALIYGLFISIIELILAPFLGCIFIHNTIIVIALYIIFQFSRSRQEFFLCLFIFLCLIIPFPLYKDPDYAFSRIVLSFISLLSVGGMGLLYLGIENYEKRIKWKFYFIPVLALCYMVYFIIWLNTGRGGLFVDWSIVDKMF